jgi:hypothetical protein
MTQTSLAEPGASERGAIEMRACVLREPRSPVAVEAGSPV